MLVGVHLKVFLLVLAVGNPLKTNNGNLISQSEQYFGASWRVHFIFDYKHLWHFFRGGSLLSLDQIGCLLGYFGLVHVDLYMV